MKSNKKPRKIEKELTDNTKKITRANIIDGLQIAGITLTLQRSSRRKGKYT